MNFEWKKNVFPIFAREFRVFACAAQKRKNLKSQNLAFFLVFRGTKHLQSFKKLAIVVLEIARGAILAPPPPAGPIIKIARLEEG